MADSLSFVSLLLVGLLGAGHCVGMCGGIAAALGFAAGERRRWPVLIGYNLGRIASYGLAGALVAGLGQLGGNYLSLGPILRLMAGLLMIAMGLYVSGWWTGLTHLERLGQGLWRRIQPLGNRLLPVTKFHQAVGLGVLWGWLPCGLVYSALGYAATQSRPETGALAMLAFGLGTVPAMLLGSVFGGTVAGLLQRSGWRRFCGLLLILFGLWTLWLPMASLVGFAGHQHPAAVHHHS